MTGMDPEIGPNLVGEGRASPALRYLGMVREDERDDKRLVRKMLAGDEESFEKFFRRYFPGLYRFALSRLGGNEDAAEEVVQTTLCKAVTKLHTFRGEAALFTWLCTFCRHEISAYYRRHQRLSQRIQPLDDVPEIRAVLESLSAAAMDGPEDRLQRKDLARLVQATLDHLPGHYGDALEWKYIHGLSVKEIAARLGLSPKAAESMLTRARGAFRDGFSAVAVELTGSHAEL